MLTAWLTVIFSALLVAANIALWWTTNNSAKRQSREMQESNAAAVRAAAAMERSADSWMDAERAWIFFTDVSLISELQASMVGLPNVPRVDFSWTNFGRTAGLIINGKARLIKIKSQSELPEQPVYGDIWNFKQEVPILPNNKRPEQVVLEQSILTEDELREIQTHKAIIVFFGFVKYRDIFSRPPHETRFCLVYQMPGGFNHAPQWIYGGPPSYNQQT